MQLENISMKTKLFQNSNQLQTMIKRLIVFIFLYANLAAADEECMHSMQAKITLPSSLVVLKGPAPVKKLPLQSGSKDFLNQFRRAFNKGEFTEDDIYIKTPTMRNGAAYQYAKIIQITRKSIIVERVDFLGKLFTEVLSRKRLKEARVDSDVKGFFKTLESRTKTAGPFKIPESYEEAELKAKGWRDVFTIGLDHINELQSLGQKLRKADIHPYQTHIVDFANQAQTHIEYIKKGIKEQNEEVEERLHLLKQISEEVQTKIREKKISYAYWLYLNYRLSILATLSTERDIISQRSRNWWTTEKKFIKFLKKKLPAPVPFPKNNVDDETSVRDYLQGFADFMRDSLNQGLFEQIDGVIRLFPSRIVIPTLHPVGVKGINRSFSDGIFPAMLANGKRRYDSENMAPVRLFTHDVEHALLTLWDARRFTGSSMTLSQFYNVLENTDLSIEEQERNEIIYFVIGHEVEIFPMPVKKEEIQFIMQFQLTAFSKEKDDLSELLPSDIKSKEQVQSYLWDSIELFVDSYDEIRRKFEGFKK